jgi:hypothetical protein
LIQINAFCDFGDLAFIVAFWAFAEGATMHISRLMSKITFATAIVTSAAVVSFAPAASASTYNLNDPTMSVYGDGTASVDLNFTTLGSVTEFGVAGTVITGVSGTVDGVSVDTAYTGLWGPTGNQYQVNSGLYADQNGSPNAYTLHGVYNTGGADYVIDNVWFPSANPAIDYSNGVAFLLNNGASDYIYGNCDPNSSCSGYTLYAGPAPLIPPPVSTGLATPLPGTWTMMLIGFLGLGFLAYRGTKKNSAALAAA